MKIGHFSYSDKLGGAAIACWRLHRALLKNDVDSLIYVQRSDRDDKTVLTQNSWLSTFTNKIRRAISKKGGRLLGERGMFSIGLINSGWARFIKGLDLDIVHLHWVNGEMMSIRDISNIEKPIVWTLHDMWALGGVYHYFQMNLFGQNYHYNKKQLSFLDKLVFSRKVKLWKKPMSIIVPSQWMKECVESSYLMKDWNIEVLPNPIDTDFWKPIGKYNARDILGLPSDSILIGFGAVDATSDKRKGFDLLKESMKSLSSKLKNFEVIIFGALEPEEEKEIDLKIRYLGSFDDEVSLKLVYNALDVFLCPSRIETFGQTASEAQACGIPVVAYDVGGIRDVVLHRHTGWLAKPYDCLDFTNGILDCLVNSNRYSIAARKNVVQKFSNGVVASKLKVFYESLLKMGDVKS